jgi:hypothetical protein
MTDLEICKRVAEIGGLIVSKDVKPSCGGAFASIHPNGCYGVYNPLTDDALNHQLMIKYKIDLDFTDDGYTRAWEYHHICGQDTLNKSTNKAILLAIIEAHK